MSGDPDPRFVFASAWRRLGAAAVDSAVGLALMVSSMAGEGLGVGVEVAAWVEVSVAIVLERLRSVHCSWCSFE